MPGANHSRSPSPPYNPLISHSVTHLLLANEIPLESTIEYLIAAATTTKSSSGSNSRDITTLFNPSPMLSQDQIKEFPWWGVRWLVVNEGELEEISKGLGGAVGSSSLNEAEGTREGKGKIDSARKLIASVQEAIRKLPSSKDQEISKKETNIICTLGPLGVLYTIPTRSCSSTSATATEISKINHLPASKLVNPIKDTTGAGDCFLGYFTGGLMRLDKEGKEVNEIGLKEVIERCLVVSNERSISPALYVGARGCFDNLNARSYLVCDPRRLFRPVRCVWRGRGRRIAMRRSGR